MAVQSAAPGAGAPGEADRSSGVRLWFRALTRALIAILVTLSVLALAALAADVVLHRVVRASHSDAMYTGISAIEVVLDGDGAVSVSGTPESGASNAQTVHLTETDSATMFDHPQRIIDRIGGTLYIAVHCPDSLCSSDLAVSVPATAAITVRAGNALRLDRATVTIAGMSGPVDLTAWPARVSISDSTSTVTGTVAGSLSCTGPSVCAVRLLD
jgi:hypothetical protein